jgi:NADPH-dependent curcumin reductase CurA
LQDLISYRLTLQGFVVFDYYEKAPECYKLLVEAVNDGRLQVNDSNETMMEAQFRDIPKIWTMLYDGRNTGKLVTKL